MLSHVRQGRLYRLKHGGSVDCKGEPKFQLSVAGLELEFN